MHTGAIDIQQLSTDCPFLRNSSFVIHGYRNTKNTKIVNWTVQSSELIYCKDIEHWINSFTACIAGYFLV